jgi:hypothetical protein
MRILLCILLAFDTTWAMAADQWNLVWITRSGGWLVSRARGDLERADKTLRGTLTNDEGIRKYSVAVEIQGRNAQATFEITPSDVGRIALKGHYDKITAPGDRGCSETIWLDGGSEHVGLARNFTCESQPPLPD